MELNQVGESTYVIEGPTNLGVYVEGFPAPAIQWQSSADDGASWADYGTASTDGTLSLPNAGLGSIGTAGNRQRWLSKR